MTNNIDDIDRKLLALLQENGRMTNKDLASAIGLSPTPCLERVRRLEQEGIIKNYQANVDATSIGYPLLLIVSVLLERTSASVYEDVEKAMATIPEVQECLMVTGDVDYILKVRATSIDHFRNVLTREILKFPFIKITHSMVVMQEVKTDGPVPVSSS